MAKSAMWILVFYNHLLVLVLGWLPPPQNTVFSSENFNCILKWEPGAGSPPDTLYTVEILNLKHSNFMPVKECTNITVWICDLSCKYEDISSLFWARVKSIINTSESNWTESSELQPFRDTCISPPIVSVTFKESSINVTLTMPRISLKEHNNSSLKTWNNLCGHYIATLQNSRNQTWQSINLKADDMGIAVTVFNDLVPGSIYCIIAKIDCIAGHSRESKRQCYSTPAQSTDIQWLSILVGSFFMILIVISFVTMLIKLGACLNMGFNHSELPKSLAILYQDIHLDWQSKELDEISQGDHISFISDNDFTDVCHNHDQSITPAVNCNLQPTPLSYHFNTDESIYYQRNGLNNKASEDYNESKYLTKELKPFTHSDINSLPLYIKASTDKERCSSLYQQCVNSQSTEQPKNTDLIPSTLVPDTWKNNFGVLRQIEENTTETKEDFLERIKNPFFDVPLSSVKLLLNDDSGGDKFEVAPYGVETSVSNSDTFNSQFPESFEIAEDKITITRQGYESQPVKLPQLKNYEKLQVLRLKSSFQLSHLNKTMEISGYEAH